MRTALQWLGLTALTVALVVLTGVPLHAAQLNHHVVGLVIGSTLATNVLTLSDIVKGMDPDGSPARVIELLSKMKPFLEDMTFMEGNELAGHRTTVRTGLPTAFWRLLNQGIQPSKSSKAQITESCGMLEAYSECDVEVANLGGNPGATRLSEAVAFLEAMAQEAESTLFYGNSSSAPEEFNGLSVRYSSLSAANRRNIVSGGGSDNADNSSIWLVGWGEQSITGIYPKGSSAGLKHIDHGVQLVRGASGVGATFLPAYVDQFQWKCGIVLKDWRGVIRIPNIDMSALIAETSDADLTKLLTKAYHRKLLYNQAARWVIYANPTVVEYLDIQRQERVQTGGQLGYIDVDGKNVLSFRGIPIKPCESLLETEAPVT